MIEIAADLHVHTVLSPCADPAMTPPVIVETALRRGLDVIAVCDHNAAGNVEAVREAAGEDLLVLPGIEITTSEEVHVLGLFAGAGAALAVAAAVRETLPALSPGPRPVHGQKLVDASGRAVGVEDAVLSACSGYALADAVDLIRREGGLAVAAHVDRPSYSVRGRIGFFPEDARFDAYEVSAMGVEGGRDAPFRSLGVALITGSDSHFPAEIGLARTVFTVVEPSWDEIRLALLGSGGRGRRFA